MSESCQCLYFRIASPLAAYRIGWPDREAPLTAVWLAADAAHPRGPPPVLVMGVDDIFWVNQLHAGLVRAGYYAGEDEMEEWIFGEGTQSALLTFLVAPRARYRPKTLVSTSPVNAIREHNITSIR